MSDFGKDLIYDRENLPEKSLSTSGDANLNYQVSRYQKGGEYTIAILMGKGRETGKVATTPEGRQVMELTFSKEVSIESALATIELLGLSFAQKFPKEGQGNLEQLKQFAQGEIFQGGTEIEFHIEDEKVKGNKFESYGWSQFIHRLPRQEKTSITLYRMEYKDGKPTGKVHHYSSINFKDGKMKVRKEKDEIINNSYFPEQIVSTTAKLWANHCAHLQVETDFWKEELRQRLSFAIPPLLEVESENHRRVDIHGAKKDPSGVDIHGAKKDGHDISFEEEEKDSIRVRSLTDCLNGAIHVKQSSTDNLEEIAISLEEEKEEEVATSLNSPFFNHHHSAIQQLLEEYRSIPHPDVREELRKKQALGAAENPTAAVKADLLDRRGNATHIYMLICAHINTLNKQLPKEAKLPYPPLHPSIESLDGILKPQPLKLDSEVQCYAFVQEQNKKVQQIFKDIESAGQDESKQAKLYAQAEEIVRSLNPYHTNYRPLSPSLYDRLFKSASNPSLYDQVFNSSTRSQVSKQKRFQINPEAIEQLEEQWKIRAKQSLNAYEKQIPPRTLPPIIEQISAERNHLLGLANIVKKAIDEKKNLGNKLDETGCSLKETVIELYKGMYKSPGNVKGSAKCFQNFNLLKKALEEENPEDLYPQIIKDLEVDFFPVVLAHLQSKIDKKLLSLSKKVSNYLAFPGPIGGKKEKQRSKTWNAMLSTYGLCLEKRFSDP